MRLKRCKSFLFIFLLIICTVAGAETKRAAVIIDIDDTLMDTRGRTREILLAVGLEHHIPELQTLTLEQTSSSCHKTCENVGLRDEALLYRICGDRRGDTELQSLWGKHFFLEPSALRYDHVVPGTVNFLQKIAEFPVHIVYLSGRKGKYLSEVTREQLAFHGFPLAKQGDKFTSEITLKPESSENNLAFKKGEINKLNEKYNVIFAIDDSAKNIDLFRNMLDKKAMVVHVTKEGDSANETFENIQKISNFRFNESIQNDQKARISNKKQLDEIFDHIKQIAVK